MKKTSETPMRSEFDTSNPTLHHDSPRKRAFVEVPERTAQMTAITTTVKGTTT
jgi:hypothetical protein